MCGDKNLKIKFVCVNHFILYFFRISSNVSAKEVQTRGAGSTGAAGAAEAGTAMP